MLGMQAKPQLIKWANKIGLDGYEVDKWVDALARIGTLIHYMVECDIKQVKPELSDYSPNEIDSAETAFIKWMMWRDKNKFELIDSETPVVSDVLRVGGTYDIYAVVNGVRTLLDIKSSKACYSEHRTQVVAYRVLGEENRKIIEQCRIIRIGRSENEGFEDIVVGAEDLHWKRFLACLDLYRAVKNLENAGG